MQVQNSNVRTTNLPLTLTGCASESPVVVQSGITREYLSFHLGREEYGIDILKVQEIRSFTESTRLA